MQFPGLVEENKKAFMHLLLPHCINTTIDTQRHLFPFLSAPFHVL